MGDLTSIGVELRRAAKGATLFRTQRHTLPQSLILFVTSRCNARCAFCLYADSVADPHLKADELTVAEYERIARSYGPLHYLALSGGEPFLRSDIAELCQPFVDHCNTQVIDIPSNFAFGDRMVETVQRLAGRNPRVLVDLQLSIDHLDAAHDASRQVAGLFERAIEAFERLDALRPNLPNLRLKVNLVWLPSNRDDIAEIHRVLAQRLRWDRIQLTYPQQELPVGGSPDELADFDRFAAVADRLAASRGRSFDLHAVPLRAARRSYHGILRRAVAGTSTLGESCEAGRHVLVVNEVGEVFPCEILWESIGNVRGVGYDLGQVLDGDRYATFREERLGPGKCNCTWSCAALSAVATDPKAVLGIAARTLKLAARP